MVKFVARTWLLAASVTATLAAAPAFAAKDVVVAVGSISRPWIPMTPTTPCHKRSLNPSIKGLFGWIKMKLKNVLAESYTVSDNGLVYTIKLKSGVKFQDGTDFNAEAVKVNLDRASNPENSLKRYNLFKTIASTEVVDPSTVKITLKRAVLRVYQHSGASGNGDDLPGSAEKIRQRDWFPSCGYRAV